jgi:D-glycero-alpha-D-manno-heptose 1-phosphate guanylyltransferase
MEKPTAVILAGGLGTRISRLLDGRPKPLAMISGKPFLAWLIAYLVRQGITDVIVSAGYRAEMLADFCAGQSTPNVRVRCIEETEPQGTAGGFLHATAGESGEMWLVCNGDTFIGADLSAFTRELDDRTIDGALIGLHSDDAGRFGNLHCDEHSNLLSFDEKTPGAGLVSAGVYLLRHALLDYFPGKRPLSFETDVFPALLRAGKKLRVHQVRAPFIDIGTEESFHAAETFLIANQHYCS